jgi:putative transposase
MCTFERHHAFRNPESVQIVRGYLLRTAANYEVEVVAYCFMPDHLHALVGGLSERAEALKCVAMFRQRSGYEYLRRTRQRLWQEGYFDRVLRSEEATVDVVRYILANPVRGGLCTRPEEYQFSGSAFTLA